MLKRFAKIAVISGLLFSTVTGLNPVVLAEEDTCT